MNTVFGVMVDMDRGTINFYKDSKDLGQAYVAPELRDGELVPFVHSQVECAIEVFHPSVYPLATLKLVEPVPPLDPVLTEYSTRIEDMPEDSNLTGGLGSILSEIKEEREDDTTLIAHLENSMQYDAPHERRQL